MNVDTAGLEPKPNPFPLWFWIGVALIGIWWPIAWIRPHPIADLYFFPLWLGFILFVDGLVMRRTGSSLIQRAGWRVAVLFVLSVPLWWLFEAFNQILQNWDYHLPEPYSRLGYGLRASVAFSTVIPAVFVASELVRSFNLDPLRFFGTLALERRTLILLHLAGWVMLVLVLSFPDYAFPLVWISVFFMIDPLATLAGGRSIGFHLRRGDWMPVFNVAVGTLICGFFWELWNLYAMPKWTYSIPYFEFWHVFEMPILGYGGYISFGWEIFAIVALCAALMPWLRVPMPFVERSREIDQPGNSNL